MEQSRVYQQMIEEMQKQSWRITGQRKELARLFAEAAGYLSPTEIYEEMSQDNPGVSFDTVYRNLRLLHEIGALEQVHLDDGVKFKAACHAGHHHHLICVRCEKTLSVDYCPMEHLERVPDTFQVTHHKFEIFGYCEDCLPV